MVSYNVQIKGSVHIKIAWNHNNLIIEIKCPVGNERVTPVHYDVPV